MDHPLPWKVIINSNTCRNKSWDNWQRFLSAQQINFEFQVTNTIGELEEAIIQNLQEGYKHYLFAGGDGSLHHGGNILIQHAHDSREITVGVLPCGTGNDWHRSFGIHRDQLPMALRQRSKMPLGVLCIRFPDGRKKYAFNMLGGALDAAVVQTLNEKGAGLNGAIKYPLALLLTLIKPHTWSGQMVVDDRIFEGNWLTIQAGFGKYCGGGMYVLPHAHDDKAGVLLMKPKSIIRLLTSLPKLYNGKIANQKEAIATHFHSMNITHTHQPIPLECDGEWLGYSPVQVTVVAHAINRLSQDP